MADDEALERERRAADQRLFQRARRDVRRSLETDGLLDAADPLLIEQAARALARARHFASLIAGLDPDMLAETTRGKTVHPYIGHERELRTEFRLHLQALRGPRAPAPKEKDQAGVSDSLGPPRRALSVVDGARS